MAVNSISELPDSLKDGLWIDHTRARVYTLICHTQAICKVWISSQHSGLFTHCKDRYLICCPRRVIPKTTETTTPGYFHLWQMQTAMSNTRQPMLQFKWSKTDEAQPLRLDIGFKTDVSKQISYNMPFYTASIVHRPCCLSESQGFKLHVL